MRLGRLKQCKPTRNHCFVLGVLFGLVLTLFIPEDAWTIAAKECPQAAAALQRTATDPGSEAFEPHLNLVNKPMSAKKLVKNIVRPRYYTSELGIREKLFVGVLTAQDRIDTLATAFNRTAAHLVDKIKFFINADNVRTNFRLKNIVGFTDTRENLRPFHVLKYIADNYLNDYDYFLLTTDDVYVDARRLVEQLQHLSISFDVYLGRSLMESADGGEEGGGARGRREQFCDLRAGIVLSSSVIRKIRANLDWCVRSAVSSGHSVNIGRCVGYSTQVGGCQQSFQGIQLHNYQLNTQRIYRDLSLLRHDERFNRATFLFPTRRIEDVYTLHTYFSRVHLDDIRRDSIRLNRNAWHISNGTLPNDILEVRWPLGVPESAAPETRHDILPWTMLNETHQLMPDHERNVRRLSPIDADDLRSVLNRTLIFAQKRSPDLVFDRVHTAYKRFDPIRGMDYRLMLRFVQPSNATAVLRSYEVVKPLGRVEIVTSPYVTESTRIAFIVPVFEHQIEDAQLFVHRYEQTCMASRDTTFLLLVFVYRADSPNKGDADVFGRLKTLANNLTEQYHLQASRVAWLSVRLPASLSEAADPAEVMASSTYGRSELLSLVVIDLALPKIGLKSLVLVASVGASFRVEFLNRVRMNTIEGFQVFSPVAFRTYPCKWTGLCKECDTCDVSSSSGYFDRHNTDVVAFYSQDYVDARKALRLRVPIVRSDNDIETFIQQSDPAIRHVVDLFVAARSAVHILRSIEPQLRLGAVIRRFLTNLQPNANIPQCPFAMDEIAHQDNNDQQDQHHRCIHLAGRKQLGDVFVKMEELDKAK